MDPLTPEDDTAALDDSMLTEPEAVSTLAPDEIDTAPPTSLVPLPAVMDIEPPVVDPTPELKTISPPAPFVDVPALIEISPPAPS